MSERLKTIAGAATIRVRMTFRSALPVVPTAARASAVAGAARLALSLGLWACHGSADPIPPPDATVEGGGDAEIDAGTDASAADAAMPDGPADQPDAEAIDAGADGGDAGVRTSFCSLPGSVVWTAHGATVVAGASMAGADPNADVSWLGLPAGFCAHYFATVRTVRQLKFAPGGDLFASSPTETTTGGANDGIAGIVVLPDADRNGVADANLAFLSNLPAVQGLMFAGGYLYYQDRTAIRRISYRAGDRQAAGSSEVVTDLRLSGVPQDGLHWPKVFDVAQDGSIFITNGGSQGDQCLSSWQPRGGVFRLEADGGTTPVATGFRNPIAMRCERSHNVCLVVELALDYSADSGGREKLVALRPGDNWGFPCCATQNLPYAGVKYADTSGVPDCSAIPKESEGFVIGHTPFGVDFEPGSWPAPWTGRAFVTLHGVVGSFAGARVVAVALDGVTGLPLPATELDAGPGDNPNNMLEFATGWDDGRQDHGRPAPIVFAPDGRMFVGDDQRGAIVWIAPVDLMIPP